jgi:hypothetical protein
LILAKTKLQDRQAKLKKYEELVRRETDLLAKMRDYRQHNQIEFFDKAPNPGPNPRQAEILEAWMDPSYKVFTYTGGNRAGKTTLGVLVALSTMFGKYPWNNKSLLHLYNHNNPRKIRYVGQDWEKHIKAVLIPELEKWWPKSRLVKKKKNNVGIDAFWVDEKTGSTLEVMSNGQESELHEGWSGDAIVYDEPPKRDIRVANARGLVDRLGRELFCMTLLKEAWVDREVIKATLPDGKPDPAVFNVHAQSYDNVGYGISREGLEIFASKLTDEEREARLKGIPSYMSGLVYPYFSRKTHLVDRFKVPLDWMVDIAIDVHPREKQAVLFLATDPRNDRYACEEIWDHGDGKWIAESIVRAVKYNAYRVNRVIIDPLAKGDQNNDESVYQQVARVLLSHGHTLEIATKDKAQGILEVKKHLMGPNKKPSIFFFNDLVRTLYEIEGYMWDQETQKPADKDDHMMENLYRLLLLNTQWSEDFDDYSTDNKAYNEGRDAVTGY